MLQSSVSDGSKLFLIDDLHPEDNAMLQALYSRSAESVEVHLEKLKKTGSGKFMESFYINYNHKSIGDGGSTTLFIENVSLLAAKAIQDWPLYRGQETSTRFIDMAKQRIIDPIGTPLSKTILDGWMNLYRLTEEPVEEYVRSLYPRMPDEKESVYNSAVKARGFDIRRGFLPAGICTQLSWHTDLRQAGDHLVGLCYHPSKEVSNVGYGLSNLLREAYKSSGQILGQAGVSGVAGGAADREEWYKALAGVYTYTAGIETHPVTPWLRTTIQLGALKKYESLISARPRGAVLPHFLSDLGQISYCSRLDFGSFRDIQRQRNGVCRMPLLTGQYGFEAWYTMQLPESLRRNTQALIENLFQHIASLPGSPVEQQYYYPLGTLVDVQLMYCLPAMVYVMELRSPKHIHPTLRKFTHRLIDDFEEYFPNVSLHVDRDLDDWSVRRGQHTITDK